MCRDSGSDSDSVEIVDLNESEIDDDDIIVEDAPSKSFSSNSSSSAVSASAAKAGATRLLFANEVERHLELMWREQADVLSAIFNSSADTSMCPKGFHLRQHDWRIFFLRGQQRISVA